MKTISRKALLERKAREFARKAPTEVFNGISSSSDSNAGGCDGKHAIEQAQTASHDGERPDTLDLSPSINDLDRIRPDETAGVPELGTIERLAP